MMVKAANDRDPFPVTKSTVTVSTCMCVFVCVWKDAEVIAGHVSTE